MSDRILSQAKLSNRVSSEGKLTEWGLSQEETVKPDFVEKGNCQNRFYHKRKLLSQFLSQEEIVKLVLL